MVGVRKQAMVGLLTAALAVSACSGSDAPPATTQAPATSTTVPLRVSDGVLSIGVLYPQTGPGAAPLGRALFEAVNGAVTEINAAGGVLGSDMHLTDADEASDTGMAELIASGVDAIVGPASSLVALRQLAIAVDAGIVVCSPTASAIALDTFPDQGYFFRTIPSDALQMAALEQVARATGGSSVAIAYLDDPYGRGLANALEARIQSSGSLELVDRVPFSSADEDLTSAAEEVQANNPDMVAVLADGDEGGRYLSALDTVGPADSVRRVFGNDAIRSANQVIAGLSDDLRSLVQVIAPRATFDSAGGFFAAHAIDCVNLIALAAARAQTDQPRDFRNSIATVSFGGRECTSFANCLAALEQGDLIDYKGLSGPVDVRSSGELNRAEFVIIGFEPDGSETAPVVRTLPSP